MLKRLITLSVFLTLTWIGSFFFASSVQAQQCNGSVTCCTAANTVYVQTPIGCQPPNCTGWTAQCSNSGNTYACSFGGANNTCGLWVPDSLCNFQMSGGCQYVPPPPSCGAGQQLCNTGCIVNQCRPTTKSCAQWAAEQCSSGGGGGGSCGSCSDWCAGADQCGPAGGTQVGSRCSGGSCSPGTFPCLVCSGGPAPGDPPPPTCTANIGGYAGPPPASWWLDIPATQPQTNPATVDPGQGGGVLGPFSSSEGWYHIDNAMDTSIPAERNGFYRLEMFSSNPSVLSVSQNYYEWNLYGPTFSWQALSPGTVTLSYYVYGKPCPACGWTLSCTAQKQVTVNAPCTPNCSGAQCGQNNGCGSTCPSTDSGTPSVPTPTSPLSSQSPITVTTNTVTLAWSGGGVLTDNYYVEAYPVGGSCSSTPAFCGVVTGTSYSFNLNNLPGTQFQWRVRAQNTSCGAQNSAFSAWQTVGVLGTISGGFYSGSGTYSGGNCTGDNTPATIGSGASLTVNGKSGQILSPAVSGSTFSVSPWFWSPSGNNQLVLNPGTAPNGEPYTCTCPNGCMFSGVSSPSTNRRFYIQQNDLVNGGWWQVLGGSAYAGQTSSVAMRSYVPTFYCTLPSCRPYILAQDIANNTDSAGIAVTGGGAVDSVKDNGNQATNITQRGTQAAATGSVFTRVRENYAFFAREMSLGLNPTEDFAGQDTDAQKPTIAPSGGKSAYYRGGNMTIQSPWQVTSGESITIFVNGDLTISDPTSVGQLIQVEEGGFLAFIVSGDINIATNVGNSTLSSLNTNIEGIYVADGTINIPSVGTAGGGDERLVLAGTFVGWTNVSILRDFDDGGARKAQNNTIPATTVIFRPDFILNTPEQMTRSSYIWQETN